MSGKKYLINLKKLREIYQNNLLKQKKQREIIDLYVMTQILIPYKES